MANFVFSKVKHSFFRDPYSLSPPILIPNKMECEQMKKAWLTSVVVPFSFCPLRLCFLATTQVDSLQLIMHKLLSKQVNELALCCETGSLKPEMLHYFAASKVNVCTWFSLPLEPTQTYLNTETPRMAKLCNLKR